MSFFLKLLSSALLFSGSMTFAVCLSKKPERALRYAETLSHDASELCDRIKTLGFPLREAIAAMPSENGFLGELKKETAGGKDIAFAARTVADRAEKEGLLTSAARQALCDLFHRLGEGSAENQEMLISGFIDRMADIKKELAESAAKTKKLCLALGAAAGLTAAIMTS